MTSAQFIAPDLDFDGAPLLRRETALATGHGKIVAASLKLSALGIVEASLNGHPVSDDVFTPGWTSYEWRLRYADHDVTDLVAATNQGALTIGLALGNGWYRGRLGWRAGSEHYGEQLAGYAELRITFEDGHEQLIVTDGQWQAGPSQVTANSLYDGQSIDARRLTDGWNTPGFDASTWVGVHTIAVDPAKLEPYLSAPVRRLEEIAPQKIWTSPAGKTLIDFGQNFVGWVRLATTGSAGHTITIRHAEVLEHGELGVRPLRYAKATDRFTLSGRADTFEPTFTFHGFRYIEIDGWTESTESLHKSLQGIVVGTDLRRTGSFRTSDSLLNQLHKNVVWGMRGNFLDLPTDCPQRDERLGWTGDIAVFAPTAAYLADVGGFLRGWLRDLAAEQANHVGVVPLVVPDILKYTKEPDEVRDVEATAIWSDAAVWVPWAMWMAYGDRTALEEAFPAMISHIRRVKLLLSPNGLWDTGFQFGDWLDPDAPPNDPDAAKADKGVVATASFYRSAVMAASTAAILGHDTETKEFQELAGSLREAFRREYITNRSITSDCTTVYALAITFGLLNQDELPWAGARLAQLVQQSEFRISTGFAGTPFIMDALTASGHIDEAYELLMQRQCPSWLYAVTMGATTVWERWDSMLPDGSINPGEMTSFNHYALGSVADWLHRTVGGISPLEPGYSRFLVAPKPGGGLSWAETSLDTPLGLAAVRWELVDGELVIDITVPRGSTALVQLEGAPEMELTEGTHSLKNTLAAV
ncbi:family 78 glycoside hydrolase catalytic domain [Paenarthrobacter nicotinovorans]|uniref:family 78 glycoside hydrolase catalytic domain n=1 Tax=Paenarthrobacter nicotinovorans TaxID=29320 RepID=UPI00382BEDFB